MDEKIKYIMESNEIRNKLCKMGICHVVGPTDSLGPTSYDVIAFVSYPNTTVAGIALIGASRIIQGITNKILIKGYSV